ncbi:MAG: MipA/OmpV family protein [Betaproteobacteria bacterium]|nr:MipA/OmpV family protein [Betaproteobacteria bacterium]
MDHHRSTAASCTALALCIAALGAVAATGDDPVLVVPLKPGGAMLGFTAQSQRSLYRGGGTRNDLFPLYVYEGNRFFLEGHRVGLRLDSEPERRINLFLGYRLEGFPHARIPASLAGMANRTPGVDVGISYRQRSPWGTFFGEVLHDAGGGSNGNEMRVGYNYPWTSGRLELRPQFAIGVRDGKLNNYYYGVRPSEATAARAAYQPGGGINAELGLSAVYRVSERWRLTAGVSATRWSSGVLASPIVERRSQMTALAGVAYDFTPGHNAWPEGRPLIVKIAYGKSSDCTLARIMRLACTSTSTSDRTRIAALELGRPFIERLNGWPLDFVGYVGLLRHSERGLQDDSMQLNAYMKGYYYGFPWSNRLRTRVGFGVGFSYAERVPFIEVRDQVARGRDSSKLLNYLDPSIDVSVGDLVGAKSMGETYLGLGVSHRSGIFGASRLFGNVSGGSNYIYSYVEWKM